MERTPRAEDYIQQLANYIKKNLTKGYTPDSLRISIEAQGYSRSAFERALKLANEQLAAQAPIMKEKPIIKIETEPPMQIDKKSFWTRIKNLFS